jgi:hypothetical protein
VRVAANWWRQDEKPSNEAGEMSERRRIGETDMAAWCRGSVWRMVATVAAWWMAW